MSENTVLSRRQKKSSCFIIFIFWKTGGASNPTFGQPKIYFYKFRCFWSNLNDDDNRAGEKFLTDRNYFWSLAWTPTWPFLPFWPNMVMTRSQRPLKNGLSLRGAKSSEPDYAYYFWVTKRSPGVTRVNFARPTAHRLTTRWTGFFPVEFARGLNFRPR